MTKSLESRSLSPESRFLDLKRRKTWSPFVVIVLPLFYEHVASLGKYIKHPQSVFAVQYGFIICKILSANNVLCRICCQWLISKPIFATA